MTSRRIVTRRCVKAIRSTRRAALQDASGDRSSVKWAATSCGRGEPTRGTRSSRCWSRSRPSTATYFHAVMQGCRRLSNSRPEIDGLDDLLLAPEQHLHDVTIERERRRSRQGYATPADARAFLEMARQPPHTRSGQSTPGSIEINPIVTAYFRAADEAPESSDRDCACAEPRPHCVQVVAVRSVATRATSRNRSTRSWSSWPRPA